MRRLFPLKLALASVFIGACVTINVYFPAAAAEKAADKIITDVLGEAPADGAKARDPDESPGTASIQADDVAHVRLATSIATVSRDDSRVSPAPAGNGLLRALAFGVDAALNFLVAPAHAQAPDLDISSPAIAAITDSMRERSNLLKKYYDSGAVGFTADGTIEIRDQNLIPLPERGEVRRLVAGMNKDHAALYAEIAAANNHPEWENDIRRTFGERFAARAKQSGWYFRNAAGQWQK